jgi:putative ABC transport system ATP-binding protein
VFPRPVNRFWPLLPDAARRQGTTVILVTHDARVAAYADRQVIVRDGQVSPLSRSQVVRS